MFIKQNLFKYIAVLVIIFQAYNAKLYDDYALYILYPENGVHVRFLQDLQLHKYMDVIFWNCPNTRNVLLMVNRNDRALFKERTSHFALPNKIVFENVQKVFDQQMSKETPLNFYRNKFEHYRTLDDIYSWLHEMVKKYPQFATLETIGKTYENRSIYAFNIARQGSQSFGVMVEAGAHAHEWISTTFATFLIEQLLTSNYKPIIRLRGDYRWYIIPVLNPDGYVYAQTTDRLWRKNRRVFKKGKLVGVDLDRNFGYSWGVHDSSPEPEDELFQGPAPFSELETQALRSFIHRRRDMLLFYFSIQGFGQKFIIPFGDVLKRSDDYKLVKSFISDAINKIFQYSGRRYYVGNAFEMLGHKISGNSASWVKYTFSTPYVMTIRLRDNGPFGHALPPNQTLPACREMMLAITEILKTRPEYERAKVHLENYAVASTFNREVVGGASGLTVPTLMNFSSIFLVFRFLSV